MIAYLIYSSLILSMKEASGIMPLSDVYCVVNRARGLAGLVSPEDIIAACGQLQSVTRFTDEPMVNSNPSKKLESRDYVVLTVCHSYSC